MHFEPHLHRRCPSTIPPSASDGTSQQEGAIEAPPVELAQDVDSEVQHPNSADSTEQLSVPARIRVQRIDSIAVARSELGTDPESNSQPQDSSSLTRHSGNRNSGKLASSSAQSKRSARRRPDPIVQSMMLLVTMGVMLTAARFAVPRIVEEIRYSWHRGELRAEYETGTDGLRNVSLDALSDAYQMVTAVVGPSVVHIEVQRRPQVYHAETISLMSPMPASDQGSGVIVDSTGYLLTNRHVIADGEDITVTLSDGRRATAVIVGTDALTDLAVLKIDSDRLIPINWGDSDRCRVGTPVWAIGSPFGLDRTVTFGILSGKHRMVRASTQYQDFMQSDVAVNPGNSGGPLVDARGNLIGINTAIVGDTYQGVSFSIPSNVAKQVYERIRDTGRVDRGWLGVALGEVPDGQVIGDDQRTRGAMVRSVTNLQSPAAQAGLETGDLIIKVDDHLIRDTGHLMRLIGGTMSGTSVKLDVLRDQQRLELHVMLGERPSELNAR